MAIAAAVSSPWTAVHADFPLPYCATNADQCVENEPIPSPTNFAVTIPTPDTTQAYQADYTLQPLGAVGVGTAHFYLGPASTSALGALESALLSAPTVMKQDIQREIDIYSNPLGVNSPNLAGTSPASSTAIDGASPQCGNQICQRYEEFKYCWDGSTTDPSSGDGCEQAWRTVDGVFSYDNNGAYASDSGDFVDCSQNRQYANGTGGTYEINPTWCGYWRQGPFSDTVHDYMDYGMNADVNSGNSNSGTGSTWSMWLRMDDYAGCGSVGNRGGTSS